MPAVTFKLSNFEANFSHFLQKFNISRKLSQGIKKDFRYYLVFLRQYLNPSQKIASSQLVKLNIRKAYKQALLNKHVSPQRINIFEGLLRQFKPYLDSRQNIYNTVPAQNKAVQFYITDYLSELERLNTSPSTVRNYKSDLIQFFSFLYSNIGISASTEIPLISPDNINAYVDYLKQQRLSINSVKRKLSSLSSFNTWGAKKKYWQILIPRYETGLTTENKQKQTTSIVRRDNFLFNYLTLFVFTILGTATGISFYQQFFTRAQKPIAQITQPGVTPRIINFQGRLTDNNNNPIVDNTRVQFKIWNTIIGGKLLYTSNPCSIIPDHNGIFYSLIGSSCGNPIPAEIFSDNIATFLGVTVEEKEEMSPRYEIAGVNYAHNADTLNYLKPSSPAQNNTIPFIDGNGQLLISSISPLIRATEGNFTLEGRTLNLRTPLGSNGNINFLPDGVGNINFNLTGNIAPLEGGFFNIEGPNILAGTLISAQGSLLSAGYNLLTLSSGTPKIDRFTVDAAGNTYISADLKVANTLSASPSGILANTKLVVNGRLYDGGLGLYTSTGTRLPVSVDFTKETIIDFNFKTGSKDIVIRTNIDNNNIKFYQFEWKTSGDLLVSECTPTCSEMTKTKLNWANDSWHHGFAGFTKESISFALDSKAAAITVKPSSNVPLLSTGYISFSQSFDALSNITVSTQKMQLTGGTGTIGGKLEVGDSILAQGQIKVGNFSQAPTAEGLGALYFNTSDNKLYYWNGTSWILTDSGLNIDSSEIHLSPQANSNSWIDIVGGNFGIGTKTPQAKLTVRQNASANILELQDSSGSAVMTVSANGNLFLAGSVFPEGSDFAEVFATDEILEAGDVVEFTSTPQKPLTSTKVGKSSSPYSSKMIGVVTEQAGFIGGINELQSNELTSTIGLLGRVPVKVALLKQDSFKAGDVLTSSYLPGFAMKSTQAGPVIARILEDFDPLIDTAKIIDCPAIEIQQYTCGIILAHIQYSWHDPDISFVNDEYPTLPDVEDFELSKIYQYILNNIHNISKDIQSEIITTSQAIMTGLSMDTQEVQTKLISPVIEVDNLIAKTINVTEQAKIPNLQTEIISPINDNGVITIQADATISGSLSSDSLNVESNATVSGTLFASQIESNNINELKSSFGQLMDKVNSFNTAQPTLPQPTATPQPDLDLLSTDQLIKEALTNTSLALSLKDRVEVFLASSSSLLVDTKSKDIEGKSGVELEMDVPLNDKIFEKLTVTGYSALADTSVSGQLLIDGNILIENNKIAAIGDTLYLTASNAIHLLGGKIIADSQGNLTVDNSIIAKVGLTTPQISPLSSQLVINLTNNQPENPSNDRIGGPKELIIKGQDEQTVTRIDDQGNASFSGILSVEKLNLLPEGNISTVSGTRLSAEDNFIKYGLNAPGVFTSGSAGAAVLPAFSQSLILYNTAVSNNSLIYITPQSPTENRTLFVAGKNDCSPQNSQNLVACSAHFTVSVDTPISLDVKFNWWIVN